MKTKNLFLTLILVGIFFTGCQKENYKEVREAFEQYVYENFGNPKNMKEITFIELKDTIKMGELRTSIIETLKYDSMLISKEDSLLHWFTNDMVRVTKVAMRFKDDFLDEMLLLYKYEDDYNHEGIRKSLKDKIKESYNDPEYYIHYLLKARISNGENNSVKEFHVYKDSQGKIHVKNKELQINEVSGIWNELLKEASKLLEVSSKKADSIKKIQGYIKSVF